MFLFLFFDIKYFNTNIFIITVSIFDIQKYNHTFIYKINDDTKNIELKNLINKSTYFIYTSSNLNKLNNIDKNINIIQTNNTNLISKFKFYSISTILNSLPYINYIFFNEEDRVNFINKKYPNIINLYNKVNVGAYKADLFRILYLYRYGGLYFDCKNILYKDIRDLLTYDEIFAKDLYQGICNGFIFCNSKNNIILKNYLLSILYNFHKELYFKENEMGALEICGPLCFGKYIKDDNTSLLYTFDLDLHLSVFVCIGSNLSVFIAFVLKFFK